MLAVFDKDLGIQRFKMERNFFAYYILFEFKLEKINNI